MRVVVADNYQIYLGRQGENRVTQVRFPYVAEWRELYGEGIFEVQTKRPGEAVAWTAQETRIVGDSVVWDVTATDTAIAGTGYCQLRYTVGSALAKSHTWPTKITESLSGASSDPPEAWQSWVDQVLQAGATVSQAAEEAVTAAAGAAASEEHAASSEENAEAWAVGTRGGTDVLTNDPVYHNNAKYYAESVAANTTAAAGSASAAAESAAAAAGSAAAASGASASAAAAAASEAAAAVSAEAAAASAATLVLDPTLTQETQAAQAKAVRAALTYEPVEINAFAITVPAGGLAEIGSTVETVKLTYALNKALAAPETLMLDDGGEPVSVLDDPSPIELTGLELSADTTYTLTATDAGSPIHSPATASKAANLKFVNRICYGAAASGTVDSAFVNALSNKVLSTTKARTISVNAGSGQYIWYCVPTRLGACTFKVGGFDGGFEAAQTISVTNASGYTENYYVYRSTNAGLGSTTVQVS